MNVWSNITESKKQNTIKFKTEKKRFCILQVTDLHLHHILPFTNEKKDLFGIKKMCKNNDVDLVVNTGDLFCFNAFFLIRRVCKKFDGIVGETAPWAFAWGNHDNENFRPDRFSRLDRIESLLEDLPNCLYLKNRSFIEGINQNSPQVGTREYNAFIAPQDPDSGVSSMKYDGTYGGNYSLEIMTDDAQVPSVILFILNSRRNYGVPPNARMWMKSYLKSNHMTKTPQFLFYHVPNVEFHKIWKNGKAIGFKRESVCYEKENGMFHEFLRDLGNVKGCFVGHDHVNDYYGREDGIYYIYGRKTSLSGYGPRKKIPDRFNLPLQGEGDKKAVVPGAKLINIDL